VSAAWRFSIALVFVPFAGPLLLDGHGGLLEMGSTVKHLHSSIKSTTTDCFA
jgi:hypothetical protein